MVMKNKIGGFTLIELLVVIVIIMLLVGLLMPALHGTQQQSRKKKSKAECMAIETAIVSYKMDTGKWPLDPGDQGRSPDKEFGTSRPNANVIKFLIKDRPPYIDIGDFKSDKPGNIFDPWGNQYIIKIDSDYDGYWHGKDSGTNYYQMAKGVEVSSTTFPLTKLK